MNLACRSFACCLLSSLSLSAAEFRFGDLTLRVPEGFIIERVAGPGLVDRPIVADFDEEGHLYVADSSGSNDPVKKQLEEKPHRIVRLTDRDGDGVFDTSTVFADRMMFPEGAMWLDGSLYVSAPPSIWKLTDTNGDGVADRREEWFDAKTLTGCANDLHGPYLGLDGWIYWCKGAFAEQTYDRPGGKPFVTRAAHIFRRRPEGGYVEPVMTGGMDNPVDVTFTAEGERIFTTTFFQHPGGGQRDGLVHAIYGGVYGKVHDVLDTHKRTGDIMPVLTHLGPAAPAGLTRYESDVFGKEFQNNLFAALFNLHKVTRHVLEPKGATFRTVDSDFVSSDVHDFHPTDVIEDADGSLLIIDTGGWYKICCPTSQLYKPDVLGAIYRVRKVGARAVEDPRGRQVRNWAEHLGDERPAVARRAVQEVRRGGKVPPLAGSEIARRNTVWALAGMQTEEARQVLRQALKDRSDSVRHAAIHALAVNISSNAATDLQALLDDPNPQIRRAAAEALGRTGAKSAVPALLRAAAKAAGDRVLEHSLIFALIEINAPAETRAALNPETLRPGLIALDQMDGGNLRAREVAAHLNSADPQLKQAANWIVSHRREWASELADIFAARLDQGERGPELEQQLANFAGSEAMQELLAKSVADPKKRATALRAMRQAGLKEAPAAWATAVKDVLRSADGAEALETAVTLNFRKRPAGLSAALREAVRSTSFPLGSRLRALGAIADGQPMSPEEFQLALEGLRQRTPLNALAKARLTQEQLLELVETLGELGPIELNAALGAFEHSPSELIGQRLITALRQAKALGGLHLDRARQLFARYPASVQDQANALYEMLDADVAKQAARIEELLPALKGGDVRRGQALFNSERTACSSCHAIGYLGGNIGPDLTRIGQVRNERDLLEAIVFPSASFVRSYEPMIVTTKDGEEYSGIVRRDSPEEVLLASGPGVEIRIARDDIESIRPGKLSVMPQGLDEQLTHQELADLLAFLKATRW